MAEAAQGGGPQNPGFAHTRTQARRAAQAQRHAGGASAPLDGDAGKGRPPGLKRVGRPSRIDHLSSVTHQGKMRCMIDQGTFTAQTFSNFLNRSVQAARGRKLMQSVDHLRVDHRKAVQA